MSGNMKKYKPIVKDERLTYPEGTLVKLISGYERLGALYNVEFNNKICIVIKNDEYGSMIVWLGNTGRYHPIHKTFTNSPYLMQDKQFKFEVLYIPGYDI